MYDVGIFQREKVRIMAPLGGAAYLGSFNARARAHRKASRGAIHTLHFMGKINHNLFACCYTQASDDDEPIVAESPNRVPGSTLDVTMQQIANVREQEVTIVRLGFGFAHKTAADAE